MIELNIKKRATINGSVLIGSKKIKEEKEKFLKGLLTEKWENK